jgi:putative redox protein
MVEGDLDIRGFFGFDDTVRPGFTAVRVNVTVNGPEPPERYQELAAAVDEHCPVLDLFQNPVPVTRTLSAAR